eukprot:16434702-Heterocapsa_arctica.AAC.1
MKEEDLPDRPLLTLACAFPAVLLQIYETIQSALAGEVIPREIEVTLTCQDARCRSVAVARLAHHCLRGDGWKVRLISGPTCDCPLCNDERPLTSLKPAALERLDRIWHSRLSLWPPHLKQACALARDRAQDRNAEVNPDLGPGYLGQGEPGLHLAENIPRPKIRRNPNLTGRRKNTATTRDRGDLTQPRQTATRPAEE